MAISKPIDIEKLINKGAKVKEDNDNENKWTYVNLRLPLQMLNQIDELLKEDVELTRTGWIRDAIRRKLKCPITLKEATHE